MRFISDIHGNWDQYAKIIKGCDESIQVGDFGFGFIDKNPNKQKRIEDKLFKAMVGGFHRFIRGNHDSPSICKESPFYINDGTLIGNEMYIGGAWSIDHAYRKEGVSWWADEELSYDELSDMVEIYEKVKPKIMVTHEVPEQIGKHLFADLHIDRYPSRTRSAFDIMFQIHKPELWVFGHWHTNKDVNILGTRFICMQELGYIDIPDDDLSKGSIVNYK